MHKATITVTDEGGNVCATDRQGLAAPTPAARRPATSHGNSRTSGPGLLPGVDRAANDAIASSCV
jgi:hypothetical protein